MKKTKNVLLVIAFALSAFFAKAQLTLVSNSLPLYQTGKLYFKIRSTSNARVTYPTVQNDSASTIGSLFTTYSVTSVEAPYKILDSTKFWKTYRVTFSDTANINSFISGLQALTTVEYAEKVPAMYTQSTPNDPNYPYHLSLINANTASNIHIATGSAIVAIVDDAVSTTQEDLVANMSSTNRDVADLDNNCDPPLTGAVWADGSRFTHGTHVSGIAGAVTNNSLGIASIGWNNKIMGVKARKNTDATNGIPFGFDGIAWAAANGAHVINMSWGGGAPSLTEYSVVVTAKSANVVLVAAAGNANSANAFYPAAYGEGLTGQAWEVFDKKLVVAVASLDANSDISNWGSGSGSNHGSWVDISAYGSAIYSTLASGNGIAAINNVYGSLNGTSMASPMVAGAAGLLKSYNMAKTADDIITCLIYTANPDIYNPVHTNNFPGMLGIGRLDVAAALMCIKPSCTYPSAVIKPSSVSLCPSSSVTLTSNPAVSYTWSTGANTQSIAVSSAGVYTLTINNGTCTASQTINIQNANTTANLMTYENSSLLPNDGIVCGPDFYSISCYSGLTYTWSPAWSTSQTLGTTINLGSSAPVSAVISVTIGGVGGCVGITSTASKTISNVPLPTIAVTPSVGSVSAGCGLLLTASGGVTYTWSPPSLVSCSVCSTPTAYPISPSTNYTVLGVDANNCFNTKTVSISVTTNTYCSGTAPASYTISYPALYNPSIGYLGQNLYLATGGNYTITCPDLRIAGNVGVYVANNATLTVDGSWLHACATCSTGMWRGIVVEPGGLLRVKNYSIIEDAIKAINTASNTSTTPVAKWEVTSSILNKNGSDIYVEKTYADMSGSYEYNTIFTCRELTSHTIGSTNFNSIRSSISAATPSSPGSHTPTVTIATPRTAYGINLNEAVGGTINVGSSSQTSNIFDNMDYGIFSAFSPIVVRNNTFQNLTGNNGIGTGILVSGNSWEVAAPTVVIGNSDENIVAGEGNNFTNCLQGVQIMGCQHVAINKNTFTNESTSTTFTTGSQIGQYAVINTGYAVHSYTDNPYEYLRFCNNYVKNYATGYYLDFGKLYNTTYINQYFLSNTITAVATSTAYCNQGIYLQQSGTFGAYTGVPWNSVCVTSNSITNVARNAIALSAINTSTATTSFVNVHSNTELSVKYNSSATSSVAPHIAAVYVSGCNRISINNNSKIQCTGLTTYPSSNAQYIGGVYVASSPNTTVNCNIVTYVGEGFVWEGSSAGSSWKKNNVQKSRFGLVLRNSGIMGDQGATSSPIGDIYGRFLSTNITDAQTLADNSNPGAAGFSSKLYNLTGSCSSATTYSPCQNNQLSGTAYAPGTTIFTTTGSLPCICTGDCGTGKLIMTSEDSLAAARDSILMDIVRGIEGTISLPSFDQETRWASQYYVSSQNSTLRSATGYNNAKTLAIVDGAIDGNNYVLAKSLLSALTPGNIIEKNWYTVDDLLIKMRSADLDNSDLSNLKTIAEKCPLTDGNIVYRARAVLNNYYKTIFTYSDNCDNNNSRKAIAMSNGSDQAQIFTIYPNPNNGYMTFAYNLTEDATLEIVDVKGIVVEKHKISAAANQMQVQNSSLADGIYFYRVVNTSNSTVRAGKLVIIK